MQRRQFITLLDGAPAAWPLAACAQQPERMRRIGVLIGAADNPDIQALVGAFLQVLAQLGWTDGRNLRIDPGREIHMKEVKEKQSLAPLGLVKVFVTICLRANKKGKTHASQ